MFSLCTSVLTMKQEQHTGQRSNALPSDFFSDYVTGKNLLATLRDKSGKSAKQSRLDARLCHSIATRARASKASRVQSLGIGSDGIQLMPNYVQNDNRTVRGTGLTVAQLNDAQTKRKGLTFYGASVTLAEQYKKDRTALDKAQGQRRKN